MSEEYIALYRRLLVQSTDQLIEQPTDPTPAEDKKDSDTINNILSYIQQHIHEDLSLMRFAEAFYFNPSYLSRLFKQAMGQTLTEYVAELKTKQAKLLLANPQLKIGDISIMLGYESGHYFAKCFKKNVDMTPQEYRRNVLRKL